ncbi:lysosomal-trafficking regulator [Trichonephila clavata]|uniref:Lysosomal-trafficking regulator n=1 Tax=Trichonephila clavata TaxID=2740835 RepID=A0A8X6HDA4_TRICU|nr:lysosomal-trafficking regulator [Trichonephila clavata]
MSEEYFPEKIALMIPHIMQKLLIFKFDGSVFKSICLFTLLLHKSSSTYVCHSRPAFFFLTIIDKLCNRKDGLNNQTSTTIWYADEVENYFPLQKEIDSSILKRSLSAPDKNSVSNSSVKENRTLLKMKSADCLDFSSDSKNMQQFSNNMEHRTDIDSEINISKDKMEVSNATEVSKISIGLLKLINSFINRDSPVEVLHLIQPEIFIVLSYTSDSEVCVSALKVLSSFLKEASENVRNSFLNIKGFHLLSNQLHQHLYDRRIFDACFSFLFDIPLLSVDLSNLYNSGEVTTFHVMSWLPLLAIIPNASSDPLICEKIVSILTKFLRLGPSIVVDLLDNGLSMSISLLIIQISQDYKVEVSNLKRKELDKCLKAIGDLMKVISIELCSSKRSKDFSELCEVLHLFSDLESKFLEKYGPDCHTVCILRDYQCIMFQVIKDLSQFWDFRTLKSDSSFLNVPVDDIATEPELHYPAETSHIGVERSILEIPMTEIINRFEYMLEEAKNFIIFKDPRIKISMKERDFIKTIFIFCIKGLGISMSKNVNIMKSEYSTLMCCLKDVLKKEVFITFFSEYLISIKIII